MLWLRIVPTDSSHQALQASVYWRNGRIYSLSFGTPYWILSVSLSDLTALDCHAAVSIWERSSEPDPPAANNCGDPAPTHAGVEAEAPGGGKQVRIVGLNFPAINCSVLADWAHVMALTRQMLQA